MTKDGVRVKFIGEARSTYFADIAVKGHSGANDIFIDMQRLFSGFKEIKI